MKILVTVDLTKIDLVRKRRIESTLINSGRFTVDSVSETSEVFSLNISDEQSSSEKIEDIIKRKFKHILSSVATVTKSSS